MAGGRKKHRGKRSAAAVADCVDLLTEILLRLPARTLIRSQCVSKQWLSLISDPQFRHNHTQNRQYPQVSGLYFDTQYSDQQHTVSLTGSATRIPSLGFLGSKVKPITQCKGLLLCCNSDSYILCNPTTKNYRLIPFPEENEIHRARKETSLICDPSISSVFKLIFEIKNRARRYGSPSNIQMLIYSSHTCSWKRIRMDKSADNKMVSSICSSRGVSFNGSLYWLQDSSHWLKDSLFRFNVDSEQFRALSGNAPYVGEKKMYFGECRGRLVLVVSRSKDNRNYWYNIYELESSHCDFWSTKYSVKLTPTLEYSSVLVARLLCVLSEGAIAGDYELVLAVGPQRQVVSYSHKREKKLKALFPSAADDLLSKVSWVCPFVETLAPV